MKIVNVRDARENFAEVIDRAAQGEAIVLTRLGRPAAILVGLRSSMDDFGDVLDEIGRLGFAVEPAEEPRKRRR